MGTRRPNGTRTCSIQKRETENTKALRVICLVSYRTDESGNICSSLSRLRSGFTSDFFDFESSIFP